MQEQPWQRLNVVVAVADLEVSAVLTELQARSLGSKAMTNNRPLSPRIRKKYHSTAFDADLPNRPWQPLPPSIPCNRSTR